MGAGVKMSVPPPPYQYQNLPLVWENGHYELVYKPPLLKFVHGVLYGGSGVWDALMRVLAHSDYITEHEAKLRAGDTARAYLKHHLKCLKQEPILMKTLTIEVRYAFHKDQDNEAAKEKALVDVATAKARELLSTAMMLAGGDSKPEVCVHNLDMFLGTEELTIELTSEDETEDAGL